jgi:transcriptional regulator with XRE-family HTH domain
MNDLGEFLRQLRLKHEERMLDMAGSLKVSPAFLSAVAHGKKKPPVDLEEKLILNYDLNSSEIRALRLAMDRVATGVRISAKRPLARETASVFARKVNGLSEKKLLEIRELLQNDGDSNE